MNPYRDERAALEAKFYELKRSQEQLLGEIDELRKTLVQLDEQLQGVGYGPQKLPPRRGPLIEPPGAQAPLSEWVRLSVNLQRELRQLTREAKDLRSQIRVATDVLRDPTEMVLPLGKPPRTVPFGLRLQNYVRLRGMHLIGLGLVSANRVAQDVSPRVFTALYLLYFGFLLWTQVHEAQVRLRLLASGKVAKAVLVRSSPTICNYRSIPLRKAQDWQVTTEFYTGREYQNVVSYETDEGYAGQLFLKGLPYSKGVILYDPQAPEVARCVDAFNGYPVPKLDGSWDYQVSPLHLIGAAVMLAVMALQLVLACVALLSTM